MATADSGKENTGKRPWHFAVSSDGTITVRKPSDCVSSMIDLAGGVYSLNGYLEEEDNALSTLKMQMEDFYVAEKDADILIYNGTIEGELNSVDELIAKNSLFADFKQFSPVISIPRAAILPGNKCDL